MSRRDTRFRLGVKGAALVAAALTVAGGGVGAAIAAPTSDPAKAGAAASLVPLSQVGLGWSIVQYSAASVPMAPHKVKGKTTLYAVSPQGHKYPFYSWPAGSNGGLSGFYVLDWSGDRKRVLVQNSYAKFEQISLVNGKVINSFHLPSGVFGIGYTRPNGLNILAVGPTGGIRRYSLTGKLTKNVTKNGEIAIDSPDGTSLIVNATYGLEQVSNLGGVIKRLHVPVAVFGCAPIRWWNATTVLGECDAKHGLLAPRLWLFPVNGGKVRALTAQRSGRGQDLGDSDAWRLTSGVYLQATGACGFGFIATQSSNGQAHRVPVPGVTLPSDQIVTGHGSSLLVRAVGGDCGGSAVLVWFDPKTKKVTWVFRTPKNIAGVGPVVPYGRPVS